MTTTLNCELDRDALTGVVGAAGVMETVGRAYAGLIGEDWESMTCIAKSKIFDGIGRYVSIGGVTAVGYGVGKWRTGRSTGGAVGALIGNMAGNVVENMSATKMFLVNSRDCAKK